VDEKYGQFYPTLYARHWWWRSREAAILDVLGRLKPTDGFGRILDVGCGDGLFFDALATFGDVEGVESSIDLLNPNGKHRTRIHVAPFDSRFQPGRRYGLVLMLDVLEHLEDPVGALRHAIRLLEPAGKILITVPAFMLLWTSHDDINHHRIRYTKCSFGRVAGGAGLRIENALYLFQWAFPVKLAQHLVEKIFGSTPSLPSIPPVPINRALVRLCRAEQRIFAAVPPPFGSSLLIVGTPSPQV
jgi:SAM-dependent methyltransferase